jgi:hypothetical protein
VVALSVLACGSGARPKLVISSVGPLCPVAGGTVSIVLGSGNEARCDGAQVLIAGRQLLAVGVTRTMPLTIAGRLPPDFAPPEGADVTVTCRDQTATVRWIGLCPTESGDGGTDASSSSPADSPPEASEACQSAIEAVIEPVDSAGRPFARDAAGVYQVPLASDDLAFDTGASRGLSGRDVGYQFTSDCFPSVNVTAPVLGGFSGRDFGLGRRCQVSVAISDGGCSIARQGQAQAVLVVVP